MLAFRGVLCRVVSSPRGVRCASVLVDKARVVVRGGDGGKGAISWDTTDRGRKVPDGGSGGAGGDVFCVAVAAIRSSLSGLASRPNVAAQRGDNGGHGGRHGRRAEDLVLEVPCGTIVRCAEGGEVLGELVVEQERILLARGGAGGRGNGGRRRGGFGALSSEYGHVDASRGEVRRLELELRSIADVALVGAPNAGKSSLLRALSDAEPRVASFPFTTLTPHLGVVRFASRDSAEDRLVLADVPGLIARTGRVKEVLDLGQRLERVVVSGFHFQTTGSLGDMGDKGCDTF